MLNASNSACVAASREPVTSTRGKAFIAGVVAFVLVGILSFGLLACSSGSNASSAQDKDVLTILGKETDLAKPYMTKIFDQYQKTTGKKLKLETVPDSDFNAVVQKRYAEGNEPDILMHFNNTMLDALNVPENFVYLNDQPWAQYLTEPVRAYCSDAQGNLLGMPFWENSVSGFYYNKKLLGDLGLKPATTQSEFDRMCRALASIGYVPLFWGDESCTWMYQFGLDPIFADNSELLAQLNAGEISYADIPEVRQMVEWVANLKPSGWIDQAKLGATWDDMSVALGSGNAVIVPVWDTWFDTDFVAGKYSKDDFELMPIFMGTASEGTYEGGNLNMMMVNKNSEKVETALEFLDFCAQPENLNLAFDGVATVSSFTTMTSNIESRMVKDNSASIETFLRVSTAEPKIAGYNASEVGAIFQSLIDGRISVDECIAQLDESRIKNAGK